MSTSCESLAQKRTLSSLLAGRVVKRPKQEDGQRLQEAAIQLLDQNQNICSLFKELGQNPDQCTTFRCQVGEQKQTASKDASSVVAASLLGCELRRQAAQLGVPVTALSVKTMLARLNEITEEIDKKQEKEDGGREILTSSQRAQLCVLLEFSRELLTQGLLCPKLLWQEFRRDQLPRLEVVYYLHFYNILTLNYIVESDEGVRSWLVPQLKFLCGWMPLQGDEESTHVQQEVLSRSPESLCCVESSNGLVYQRAVMGVLVKMGFEQSRDPASADRMLSVLCCAVLDEMLVWLLDTADKRLPVKSCAGGAQLWIQTFDSSLYGVSVLPETLERFFTHSLTQTLTYNPQLTVSDAITLQKEWIFARTSHLLTSLFRKLAVVFSVEQLLRHLQQVLETHEVNWKHVLCFVSTLLVYNQSAESSLRELLSRLLSSAFESYDLENMITAFLLARQGALEGPRIFPPYSDWFKMSFGGSSSYQANSKKSLVFLLKFLSDLVPFDPPQYLKVHILHPPYVPARHRGLLMEYVSLAKTRLADLKESVEEMGLYEDVSGASVQPQLQAAQDVEKAVSLFENTGKISATVMEASIFRRPYFLTRFLPALLKPRALPVKPDARMSFIEALKKADKIPFAQYSSYVESCQKQMQQNKSTACLDTSGDLLDALKVQLQEFTELLHPGSDGEMSAHLSRISHTLSVVFTGCPDELIGQKVIALHTESPALPELHVKLINMILQHFCQCQLNASRANPPNKQSFWASRFVKALLVNTQLLSGLLHRLWDLFHNQGPSLTAAHVLGLAVFVVHLNASLSDDTLVQLVPSVQPQPVPLAEALSSALLCDTRTNMLFSVRVCVAAVCYGICKGDSLSQEQQQEYIPNSLYKKLLYLIPRLLPEARRTDSCAEEPHEENSVNLWSSITDNNTTWAKTALHLWRHPAFRQLQEVSQYQLCFSEWLKNELRVQRSEDVLSDTQRTEYEQWACLELYFTRPVAEGGFEGNLKKLCSHLLNAIMEQQLSEPSLEKPSSSAGRSGTGTCLPDILSRLQELVYEMEVTNLSGNFGHRSDLSDFLFETVSQRCSAAETSASLSIELSLQHTLHTWNRVLLALPAVLFIKTKTEGGRTTLDCNKLTEHINQHQRKACSPAGVLPCHITGHFLKGLLCASVQCGRPAEEFNKAWNQMSAQCPLLLVSTARWWRQLSSGLFSLWCRLRDGEPPPEQLQLLVDCRQWASSLEKGQVIRTPSAAALLLAAGLHQAWRDHDGNNLSFSAALMSLRPERDAKHKQVLVLLLFLCMKDYLSALIFPQERSREKAEYFCTELLTVLVNSADWLLIFRSNEQSPYQSVTLVTSDEWTRLMPWAFCSLVPQQRAELLQKAVSCPGFLHTAISCYISVLQLYLEGDTPTPITGCSEQQLEPSQILSHTKRFLLNLISKSSPTDLSSGQLRQLEVRCVDLDPELAAALSVHLEPHDLSPEMDFF